MTLTQAAATFRLTVKVTAVVIVSLIVVRGSFFIFSLLFPKEPPPPPKPKFAAEFGKLPPLEFDTASVQFTPNYKAVLDLIAANLPDQPEVAYVYPVLKAPYGFLSEDRAQEVAKVFNLYGTPVKLSTTERVWYGPNRSLSINTQTLNFTYEYRYDLDTSVFKKGVYRQGTTLVDYAKALKSQYNIFGEFADDLAKREPKLYLLKYQSGKLQPTNSMLEASAARIDFLRDSISYALGQYRYTFEFVSPNYVGSIAYTMLGTGEDGRTPKPIEVHHYLWRYDAEKGSTYPILPSQLAWETLQQDPAKYTVYVGNLSLGPMDKNPTTLSLSAITISNVKFAYYNTKIEQDYIQPVWVFIGKGTLSTGGELDWVGYVPAVLPSMIALPQESADQVTN